MAQLCGGGLVGNKKEGALDMQQHEWISGALSRVKKNQLRRIIYCVIPCT